MNEKELQAKIIEIGNRMMEEGLTSGTGGNISGRLPGEDWFFISPSGMPYSSIKPENLVKITLAGEIIGGDKKPSIEHNMHREIFKLRKDVNAVVHTHSFYAKAVATLRTDIPPITDTLAVYFGGSIEVADYARPGSKALAANTSKKLKEKNGILVANHGAIGIDKDFDKAYSLCEMIEEAAKLYIVAGSAGNPIPLTEEEIKNELEFIRNHYGQK